MTRVEFYRNNSSDIVKFIIDGHSEFADENDIVCSAISSVSYMVLNGIEKILNVLPDTVEKLKEIKNKAKAEKTEE